MPIRAEGVIETGDGEVRVLYTNYALAQVEQATGMSILQIAEGFANNESGVTEVAQVTLRDAYGVLDEVGFGEVAAVTMEAVAEVLGYGAEDDEGPK